LQGHDFRLPTTDELPEALATVHTVLYLLVNEGYFSATDKPIFDELCRDAMSLTQLLVEQLQESGELPHSHVVAAALANLSGRPGMSEKSGHYLEAALAQAPTEHERRLIELQVAQTGRPRYICATGRTSTVPSGSPFRTGEPFATSAAASID
jgi:predicted RNA polymerase sigma factor